MGWNSLLKQEPPVCRGWRLVCWKKGSWWLRKALGPPAAFQYIILAHISDRREVWARPGLNQSAQSCRALETHNLFFASFSFLRISMVPTGLISLIPLTFSEFRWAAADGLIGGLVFGLQQKPPWGWDTRNCGAEIQLCIIFSMKSGCIVGRQKAGVEQNDSDLDAEYNSNVALALEIGDPFLLNVP